MSLRVATAAPFAQNGTDRLREHEFVVALSLDRDWFSPDQATRLIDVATEHGLLERDENSLVATFDVGDVEVPEDFTPDESLLKSRSTFERVLDAVVAAGIEKHDAVGAINASQQELGITIEAAAVVYARRQGIGVEEAARSAREELIQLSDD